MAKYIPAVRAASIAALVGLLASIGPAGVLTCLEPPNRFRKEVFPSPKETPNIQFGQNKNPLFANRIENLMMDVYQPAPDACAKRPLIIFMHGGWFQTGDRKAEAGTCRQFARRGFVSASIEYRMGKVGQFTPENFGTPALMAAQDARSAVRFFRKHAAEFGIDTALIYVGGCSAGAYAALSTAYLDQAGEVPGFINPAALEGGMEGNSGNTGFSSKVAGALSLSGGLYDTAWIVKGDPAVVSVQCSEDPIVPPGGGSLRDPNTNAPFIASFGATAIKARADHMGVSNALLTYHNSCHCPHPYGPDGVDSTVDFLSKSLYAQMSIPPTASGRSGTARWPREPAGIYRFAWPYDLKGKWK